MRLWFCGFLFSAVPGLLLTRGSHVLPLAALGCGFAVLGIWVHHKAFALLCLLLTCLTAYASWRFGVLVELFSVLLFWILVCSYLSVNFGMWPSIWLGLLCVALVFGALSLTKGWLSVGVLSLGRSGLFAAIALTVLVGGFDAKYLA